MKFYYKQENLTKRIFLVYFKGKMISLNDKTGLKARETSTRQGKGTFECSIPEKFLMEDAMSIGGTYYFATEATKFMSFTNIFKFHF